MVLRIIENHNFKNDIKKLNLQLFCAILKMMGVRYGIVRGM